MNSNNNNNDTFEQVDQPVQEEIQHEQEPEVNSDRHTAEGVYKNTAQFTADTKNYGVLIPGTTYKKLMFVTDYLKKIDVGEFKERFSEAEQLATGITIASEQYSVHNDVYVDKLNEDLDAFVNMIRYGDSDLNMRSINVKNREGDIQGQIAVNVFASLLGVGEVVQIPLWHSGFWITIRPPVQTELINLEQALGNNLINLGRDTNTLIHSNYSVVFSRIVTDFILSLKIGCSLKLPPDTDIRDHILVPDLYPLVLGLITAMHPDGINVTQECINTLVLEDDQFDDDGNVIDTGVSKKPKCDFTVTGLLEPVKLLWLNRKNLTRPMLETMSKRRPDSVTLNEVKEYQLSIRELESSDVTIKTDKGDDVVFTFKVPNLSEHIDNGELWVNNVISKAERLFTEDDSVELKNIKVNDILMSIVLGIYNIFVSKISANGYTVTDRETIDEVLSVLTSDDAVYNSFNNEVSKFISNAVIAVVATPNYNCPNPKCNISQNHNGSGNKAFKELIPLNILETFFALSVLRIEKTQARNIS